MIPIKARFLKCNLLVHNIYFSGYYDLHFGYRNILLSSISRFYTGSFVETKFWNASKYYSRRRRVSSSATYYNAFVNSRTWRSFLTDFNGLERLGDRTPVLLCNSNKIKLWFTLLIQLVTFLFIIMFRLIFLCKCIYMGKYRFYIYRYICIV